ncbi:glycoside hydrolase superfamily [Cadophora sp. MPI-SDFR-AT-0126]|nr:glycoside hydrolase superfamily [Leotiomycetes sp. MPI-SDFR-AT-0126]
MSDSDNSDDSCDADDSDDSDDSEETNGSDGSSSSPVNSPSSTLSTAISVQVPATTVRPTISTYNPVVSTKLASVPASASTTAKPTSTQTAGEFWQPVAGSTWQIELSGVVTDTSYPADVFDLDLFDTPQSTIDALHAANKKVICYFSAGSFEDWRPDQADFQAADKGSAMEGWDGEWWLNTKTANVRSIMAARIDIAASKGCDAVDPDNVDGYANANGVGLTSADGIDYLNFLADTAHAKGLSIGLKNAGDLVGEVLDKMQFHVNEQCIEYDECELFKPFIDAGKPVFHIEYPEAAPSISANVKSEKCAAATTMSFSTVLKTEALNAWIDTC